MSHTSILLTKPCGLNFNKLRLGPTVPPSPSRKLIFLNMELGPTAMCHVISTRVTQKPQSFPPRTRNFGAWRIGSDTSEAGKARRRRSSRLENSRTHHSILTDRVDGQKTTWYVPLEWPSQIVHAPGAKNTLSGNTGTSRTNLTISSSNFDLSRTSDSAFGAKRRCQQLAFRVFTGSWKIRATQGDQIIDLKPQRYHSFTWVFL